MSGLARRTAFRRVRQGPGVAVSVAVMLFAALSPSVTPAPADQEPVGTNGFTRRVLNDEYRCDGVNVGDLNLDGRADIVAGPYWWEGPGFTTRREFFPVETFDPAKGQSNSLFSYVHDFNGDRWPDVLVIGRVHLHQAFWYENPRGGNGPWRRHFAFERIHGESPPFVDIDRDGRPEVVALWEHRWGLVQPNWAAPTQPWTFRPISDAGDWHHFYHGTGVGDVNGDDRLDLVLNDGWWEQPRAGAAQATWTHHPFRLAPKGGAQIYVDDVDGDRDADLLTALDAHGWGLAWFEQVWEDGAIRFRPHPVMGDRSEEGRYGVAFSQPHALAHADVDGDGLKDLVVGKRRWAHGPTGDVEPEAPPVLYWFRLLRENGTARFVPHRIDDRSGVGTQIAAADVNHDGRVDVLTASKIGCFLFISRGSTP